MAVVPYIGTVDGQKVDADVRRGLAWELHMAGYPQRRIAAILNVAPSTICEDLKKWADEIEAASLKEANRYRRLFIERSERFITALWPAAISGSVEAIREIRALMERHARLTGLDAPTKIDVTQRVREMAIENGLDPDEAVREAERIARDIGSGRL